jgi:hypothetical protein
MLLGPPFLIALLRPLLIHFSSGTFGLASATALAAPPAWLFFSRFGAGRPVRGVGVPFVETGAEIIPLGLEIRFTFEVEGGELVVALPVFRHAKLPLSE